MKAKIVYTLVSDEHDSYLEQVLLSLHTVRLYHPEATIELVVDSATNPTIKDTRAEIKKYVSSIISVTIPEGYDKVQRSRFLKTNLRKLVTGDYLFIDCDTIICGKLDEIDKIESNIAMVADMNGKLLLDDEGVIDRCHAAGFNDLEGKPYFNSGVIYAKDTPVAHRLYEEWNKQWQISNRNGVSFDQPALCQANVNVGTPIYELPGIWNCQFKFRAGYRLLDDAIILHYYSNNGGGKRSIAQDSIFKHIKEKGGIDSLVAHLVNHTKTVLTTALTINSDMAFEYFYSDMLYTFFNAPKIFKIAASVARMLSKPAIFIKKKKQ
ncbi:MAG: hypothetical protein J5548_06690 [Prevotella sp.]|nr:hypothetical protein [Prevotella sp.]